MTEFGTFFYFMSIFDLYSVGHATLEGAMIASFGLDWDKSSDYRFLYNYVSKHMAYHSDSGEWY